MPLEDTSRREADTRFLVSGDLVLDRADHRTWLGGTRMEVGAKALALLDKLMCDAGTLVGKAGCSMSHGPTRPFRTRS